MGDMKHGLSYEQKHVWLKNITIGHMSYPFHLRLVLGLSLAVTTTVGAVPTLHAQAERHGRKYKAPPETSRIEVTVLKDFNGKPIPNAAVIFHPTSDGKDIGNFEVKTDPDGKAMIDIIPRGSTVVVQVIASGFATYAETYEIAEPSRELTVRVIRPRAQVSAYQDNAGKESQRKAGVQEPAKPAAPPAKSDTANPKP